MSTTVASVPMEWPFPAIYARLRRDGAQRRASYAPRFAVPGEPHASARARLLALEQEAARALERALLYGSTA